MYATMAKQYPGAAAGLKSQILKNAVISRCSYSLVAPPPDAAAAAA